MYEERMTPKEIAKMRALIVHNVKTMFWPRFQTRDITVVIDNITYKMFDLFDVDEDGKIMPNYKLCDRLVGVKLKNNVDDAAKYISLVFSRVAGTKCERNGENQVLCQRFRRTDQSHPC